MYKYRFAMIVFLVTLALLFSSEDVSAKFISEQEARTVVQNWLEMTPKESLSISGTEIEEVIRFEGGFYGTPGYYLVLLDQGWVIVPADDNFEAIIAFGQGSFSREEYALSPLAAFLSVNADQEDSLSPSADMSLYSMNNDMQTSHSYAAKNEAVQNKARASRWQTLSAP
jgi:hypothetical protein